MLAPQENAFFHARKLKRSAGKAVDHDIAAGIVRTFSSFGEAPSPN
jgi:hypothetical protein